MSNYKTDQALNSDVAYLSVISKFSQEEIKPIYSQLEKLYDDRNTAMRAGKSLVLLANETGTSLGATWDSLLELKVSTQESFSADSSDEVKRLAFDCLAILTRLKHFSDKIFNIVIEDIVPVELREAVAKECTNALVHLGYEHSPDKEDT